VRRDKGICQRQTRTTDGRSEFRPYDPIDMIADVEGERVTIWKTILSLLRDVDANHFEGAGLLSGLVDGWGLVERV